VGAEGERLNRLTRVVIGAALRIHSRIGPGVFESVYEMVLARDLTRQRLHVERQKKVSFEFEGMRFENAFTADLVVEEKLVIEVKAVAQLAPIHSRQVLTYLRLLEYPLGLLINFNELHLRNGIKRIANNAPT